MWQGWNCSVSLWMQKAEEGNWTKKKKIFFLKKKSKCFFFQLWNFIQLSQREFGTLIWAYRVLERWFQRFIIEFPFLKSLKILIFLMFKLSFWIHDNVSNGKMIAKKSLSSYKDNSLIINALFFCREMGTKVSKGTKGKTVKSSSHS